ncbi:MAG: YdeI/OmpD-associated family protein [Sandaracinaceae bacterium]
MKFRTTILKSGKNTTGIEIPDDVIAKLGGKRRVPVRVTINGYTYRSSTAVMGGRTMVGVSAEVRERAKVAGGDTVTVGIEVDEAVRELEVPVELSAALEKHATLATLFESLSFSNRQRLVLPIANGKSAATRERNVEKAIALLRSGELKPAKKK